MERGKIIPFRHPGRERRRAAVFLAALAVIVLVLACFAVDGGRNWDGIRRFFTYGSGEMTVSLDTAPSSLAAVGSAMAIADADGVTLYDKDGNERFVASLTMSTPVLKSGGGLILAYDAGGTAMLLLDQSGNSLLEEGPSGLIFDADIASDGAVCYVTSADRTKSQLQVLDKRQQSCFAVHASTRYFTVCAVSPGADYACAVALGQSDSGFASSAVVYRTDREEPVAEVDLGNQLIYDLAFWGSGEICAVGESELVVFDTAGEVQGRYAYTGLTGFDLAGDGFAALVLSGSTGYTLVTVDGRGRELGRVEMGMAQTVAVNGKYVAYLTGDGLTISGKRLEAWYTGQGAAAMVCICENGAAYLANARTAWRFSP